MTIEKLVTLVATEPLREWLKSKNLTHSAGTKARLKVLLEKHIAEKKISKKDVYEIVAQIQEYSRQTTHLFKAISSFKTVKEFKEHGKKLGFEFSDSSKLAIEKPNSPTLNYLGYDSVHNEIYAKFTETHYKYEQNRATLSLEKLPVTKVIVLSQNLGTKIVQIRLESKESVLPHKNSNGQYSKLEYFKFYHAKAMILFNLKGEKTPPLKLEKLFENLINDKETFFLDTLDTLTDDGLKTKRISQDRTSDVRETDSYANISPDYIQKVLKGNLKNSGLEECQISRNVNFTADRDDSTLSFNSDCLPSEVNYVLSKLK